MKIVFFGNTKYSVIDAEALHSHFGLTAIVTIPDKEVKKKLVPSPTKAFAAKHNIPVIEANKLTPDVVEKIKTFQPDFLVVADYGLILPQHVLSIPKYAPLNVHHSLLPKYRGPSPVPTMLLNDEKKTGVTIIIMNDKVDDGDIVAQKEYTVQSDDTSDSLLTTLNHLGSQAVIDVIEHFDTIKPMKQDIEQATFTQYMEKEHGHIDMANPPSPEKLDLMIRAYYPWPGVWSMVRLNGKDVRIKLLPEKMVQVEGKNPQTVKDFINGYPEAKQWLERLFQQ